MSYVIQLIVAREDVDELEGYARSERAHLEHVKEDEFNETVTVVAKTKLQIQRVMRKYIGDTVLADSMFGDIRYRNY